MFNSAVLATIELMLALPYRQRRAAKRQRAAGGVPWTLKLRLPAVIGLSSITVRPDNGVIRGSVVPSDERLGDDIAGRVQERRRRGVNRCGNLGR